MRPLSRKLRAVSAAMPGTRVRAASSLYASAPLEVADPQPDYLNAVVRLDTTLDAPALLARLLAIEARLGRTRGARHAARTIDLDLLLFDDVRLDTPELTLPHPRAHLRAFVLAPLLEIEPALAIPGHGAARALLPALAGQRLERLALSIL